MVFCKPIIIYICFISLVAFSNANEVLKGGWRIVESNFVVPDDNDAYFLFDDSTMISAWVMDGVGLVPIGDEETYIFTKDLLVFGDGSRSTDSMKTVFINDSKLLLIGMDLNDTLFLIREVK
jgi:hypothetical protein